MPTNTNTQKHLDILKKAGLFNPDVTLGQIMDAAHAISAVSPGSANSVPTLLGDWYVYHQMPAGKGQQVIGE